MEGSDVLSHASLLMVVLRVVQHRYAGTCNETKRTAVDNGATYIGRLLPSWISSLAGHKNIPPPHPLHTPVSHTHTHTNMYTVVREIFHF